MTTAKIVCSYQINVSKYYYYYNMVGGGVVLGSQTVTLVLAAPAFKRLGGREGWRDDLTYKKKTDCKMVSCRDDIKMEKYHTKQQSLNFMNSGVLQS